MKESAKFYAKQYTPDGMQFYDQGMMFKMLGVGKEDATVSCVSLSTGTRSRPPDPKYRIESETGEVLGEGSFRSG